MSVFELRGSISVSIHTFGTYVQYSRNAYDLYTERDDENDQRLSDSHFFRLLRNYYKTKQLLILLR